MDPRIFDCTKIIGLKDDLFSMRLEERCTYAENIHTLYLDLSELSITTMDQIKEIKETVSSLLEKYIAAKDGEKINMVVNYDGFDCREDFSIAYAELAQDLQAKYYNKAVRYTGSMFLRSKLQNAMGIVDSDGMFYNLDEEGNGVISLDEFRNGMMKHYSTKINTRTMETVHDHFMPSGYCDKEAFAEVFHIVEKLVVNRG
jgi:hypothetical protein